MSRISTGSLRWLAAAALAASAARASGPVFVVNATTDGHDAAAGDSKCETSPGNGVCTLRAAVEEANTTTGATIEMPAGTFGLTLGSLIVAHPMSVSGAGAGKTIVSAGNVARVFTVTAAGETRLLDLSLRDGKESGGGIVAAGTGAQIVIERSEITHGSAAYGGCIFADTVRLADSHLHDCHATAGPAGALYVLVGGDVRRSTINGCTATDKAGGVYSYGALSIVDSTISGNTAGSSGGGLYGTAALYSSTVVGNRSSVHGGGGGIAAPQGGGMLSFVDTLFAGNQESDGAPEPGWIESDCAGIVTSNGFSLMIANGQPSCLIGGAVTTVSDAHVGPLQKNGGYAPTHALLSGSAAIDGGSTTGCGDVIGVLATDARGAKRSVGARCDIGAYERTPCGDVNGDGGIDVGDVLFLINYLFAGGPLPPGLANVNQDASTNVLDVFTLINHLFAGGAAPSCPGA